MNVVELVESRRSIRKFTNRQVEKPLMHELLQQAALLCPHPERLTATRFVLAEEQQEREHWFVLWFVRLLRAN
ncbi:nitroreductase family protein [Paenibacillus senegalensis]|uniref:nitroreductase family protein n=1 Tax=Paenibacillus senegalensis TaxID=1465766 RepID=UPI00028854AC|nr:nitroreductase family protein [Paenibacillus senegalensis]